MKRTIPFWQLSCALAMLVLFACSGCSQGGEELPDPDPKPVNPDPESLRGKDADIDQWMYDYLNTHYLWNSAIPNVKPNYSLDYKDFLDDVLQQVADQHDINHDDGHWENGKRSYFYSNVSRTAANTLSGIQTRFSTDKMISSYGFEMLFLTQLSNTSYGFIVAEVNPNGPAAKAGIKRGDIILKMGGMPITKTNANDRWVSLFYDESGSVNLTLLDIGAYFDPKKIIKEGEQVALSVAHYEDNPVLLSKVLTAKTGEKVGYLNYAAFNYNYDQALIDAFSVFAEEGIDELVLDLRYNGGGHVVSSTVLGTLIAGKAHQGEVYTKTIYNESRKNETADCYKIGEAVYNTSDSRHRYDAIATALHSAVNLARIYVLCTNSTASASELIVNGLRGLDFDVRLIGETTNGKNVGMEPIDKVFKGYKYLFSPITFYSSNAEGFNDYSNGFKPDIEVEEYFWYETETGDTAYGELGNPEFDHYLRLAMAWIEKGERPTPSQSATTRSAGAALPLNGPQRIESPNLHPRHPQGMLRLPATEE